MALVEVDQIKKKKTKVAEKYIPSTVLSLHYSSVDGFIGKDSFLRAGRLVVFL